MARVLAYTSPARGHLFPLTPILLDLRARGHDVAVRTLADGLPTVDSQGLRGAAIDPAIERIEHDDFQAANARASLARSTAVFAARAVYEVSDLRAAIDAEQPDALVIDVNCWGAQAAAEASGRPYAVFSPYPLPLSSRDAPPFGPGFAPAHNVLDHVRDAVARPLVMGMIKRTNLPKVNAIRSSAGLAPLADLEEMFTRAPLLLYLSAEPFEYPRRDWPANIVMTGPMPWEPPADAPAWLDDVRAPIVLVTTSSEFQDDGRLVAAALEGLAHEPVFVIATLPAADPGAFRVPPNARVERFLPHGPILRRAAVAVTHAGMGATQKALALGVPVVAVPFGRDQPEVARRVEVARAGVRLPSGQLTPDRLRVAVREAMTMRDGAQRVAAGYEAAGGAAAAAAVIEGRLLRRGPS